jgi:hypothetical protein
LPAELELLREGLPGCLVTAADMARDDDAVLVDDRDRRVAEEPERAGELGVRIRERRPAPAVLVEELARVPGVVGNVEADELELRVTLDEPCVGDRLAIADRSPGRPHVHEDGLPAEVPEREALAVQGLAAERDPRLRDRAGRGPWPLPSPVRSAPAGREQEQRAEERKQTRHLLDGTREVLRMSEL